MKKILLTGSRGMLGRNIQRNSEFINYEWLLPSREELNLLNYDQVVDYINRNNPEMIIHAAGCVGGIQANIREPSRFLIENFDMGRNIVLAAAKKDIKELLNFGSTCMYPKDRDQSLVEEDILTGALEATNEGYALAKIAVARLCDYISNENNSLNYKTIVPCNLYGEYDNFDPIRSHLIPAIIDKLHKAKIEGKNVVEIWGSGEARREFLYIGDLVDAVFLALRDFEKFPKILNIGLGVDYTINEYYEIAAKVVGYEGSFEHNLNRPTGMNRKLSNIGRAKDYGWFPKTKLEAGLAKTYKYYLTKI